MTRRRTTTHIAALTMAMAQGAPAQTLPELPEAQEYCLGAAMSAPIWEDMTLPFQLRTAPPADLADGSGAPAVLSGTLFPVPGPYTVWTFGTRSRNPDAYRAAGRTEEVEEGMTLAVAPDGRYELTVTTPEEQTRGVRIYFEIQPAPGACADVLEDWLAKDEGGAGAVHDLVIERIAAMRRLEDCGLGACTWSQLTRLE